MSYSSQNIFSLIKRLLVFPGVFFLTLSCENDIQKIQSLTNSESLPDVAGENIEIIYTDSSRLEMFLRASEIKQYSKEERPYIEFPKGIYVEFYNDSTIVEAILKADYALYYTDEKLWEARGNVFVHNIEKNEKLNSEELFWVEDKKLIYSNSFSRIETADGTFYGQDGFESNQKFTKWKLKGSRGTVNFKEESDEEK